MSPTRFGTSAGRFESLPEASLCSPFGPSHRRRGRGAPARAVTEFDRTLLYLLAFVPSASVGRSPRRLVWIVRGFASAILIVALSAVAARLLPEVWPFGADLTPYGLEYPVGYPNALGLLVGIGLLLCVYLASSPAEPRFTRPMAVASVPPLATTLVLSRSLGAAAVTATALALFAYLARGSGVGRTAVALIPTTAVALIAAFDAGVLATADASSPHALAPRPDGRSGRRSLFSQRCASSLGPLARRPSPEGHAAAKSGGCGRGGRRSARRGRARCRGPQ